MSENAYYNSASTYMHLGMSEQDGTGTFGGVMTEAIERTAQEAKDIETGTGGGSGGEDYSRDNPSGVTGDISNDMGGDSGSEDSGGYGDWGEPFGTAI